MILSDTTLNQNFRIQYAELARFHWDTVSVDTSRELSDLTLRLSSESSADIEGFSVYSGNNFIPADRVSGNTYRVSLPREAEQITCYLPGLSGRVISLDSTHFSSTGYVEVSTANTDPRVDELHLEDILEGTISIENEWLPAAYELDRTVIEIAEWGQPELTGVVSDVVPKDIEITDLVEFVSLKNDALYWANMVLKYQNGYERKNMFRIISKSNYDISKNVRWLEDFYLNKKR